MRIRTAMALAGSVIAVAVVAPEVELDDVPFTALVNGQPVKLKIDNIPRAVAPSRTEVDGR